jgi:putative DNA primase/helicase
VNVTLQAKYDQINDHALRILYDLVQEWFPLGRMISKTEYGVANLNGDKGESLSINIHTGRWKEFAGGPGGYEPLGLYAHAFCTGDRKRAFRELRAKFGFSDDLPPKRTKGRPNHLKVVKNDDWHSMVPPPDDVGRPDIRGHTKVHEYRMPGIPHPVRYVARIEKPDGTKVFVPYTYGTDGGVTGWHAKHPNEAMCLYGLDRAAALPDAPLLIQEGEQKTDDVQGVLGDGWACVAWSGGANAVPKHDWTVATGRNAYVCGDAVDGVAAMMEVAGIIHALAASVQVWTLPPEFPKGWDLGNAATGVMVKKGEVAWKSETGPWTAEQIAAFIRDHSTLYEPDLGDADPEGATDQDSEWEDEPPARDKRSRPPIPLGYDAGHYYYLSPMTGQIEVLARKSHTKHELIGIADLQYYRSLKQFKGARDGLDWDAIGNFLKGVCSDVGFFNPDRVRGRGAWLDTDIHTGEVRAVMNLGNRLLVNGESLPLLLPGSTHIYEAARPLKYVEAPPLTKEQAGEVAELCKLFCWEKPIYGTLMAGWLAVAPICGALSYRPAIWVTGGSGSGKSTLESLIAKPLLGDIGLFLKGGTTEAGVRQKLGRDARPLWFDEAEAESQKAKGIMQGLLDLNRQSSSEGGAEIIKGTQNQAGAKTYHVKSCFAFSAINPTLDHMADENRMSVLELTSHGADARADFDVRVVARAERTITPEFCAGFVARSVWLMPVILDNAKTFSKAVAVHLGSSRIGDQVGALLAGAFSEISDNRVSPEAAREWVEKHDWGGTTSADAQPDERKMLDSLMQERVTLDHGNRKEDLMLAEVVRTAAGENGEKIAALAQAELLRHGIKFEDDPKVFEKNKITFEEGEKPCGVWISNTHTALKKHLEGTPWSSQWSRTLRRLPGVVALDRTAPGIRFAGELGRAVFVPLGLIG